VKCFPGDPIQESSRGSRGEDGVDLRNPTNIKTIAPKHGKNSAMLKNVEGFFKIKFEDDDFPSKVVALV
jgi:hypothetical protein